MNTWNDALFAAAQKGEAERVRALLQAADTRKTSTQEEMLAALQIAIGNDFPGVVRVLCTAGAPFGLAVCKWNVGLAIPGVPPRNNFQPIHLAASVGSTSCIAALVSQFGVPVDSLDGGNETPLHWACRFSHVDAIRELLALNANAGYVNSTDYTPAYTPLEVAVIYGHIRCIAVLAAKQLEEAVLLRARRRSRWSFNHCRAVDVLLDRALRLHKSTTAE